MDKRRLATTLLSVPGIFVSGYLTYIHYSGEPLYCGGSNSCELVNSSRFAFIGPIPVSALGLGAYIAILILSLIKVTEERQWPAILTFGVALIGVMFQWYLFYIEVAVLHALCYWCVASQTIITLIFMLALPRRTPDEVETE
ncbi:MAG TPA: vitamin K epoxide reductase family protein [Anaerolineae bacterium]|nr:vitamin K epoxide reductase family protein [Anaerolineae bacterium]